MGLVELFFGLFFEPYLERPSHHKPGVVISDFATQPHLPLEFELLVWNIQKGQQQEAWQSDFNQVNQNQDLTLIQEGLTHGLIVDSLLQQTEQSYIFGPSFQPRQDIFTGVMTGSRAKSLEAFTVPSKKTEPFTNTPKASLIKVVSTQDNQMLLVINTHSLNFVSNSSHKSQIKELLPTIKSHSGPVLWAGDFNTWNSERQLHLDRKLESVGLTRVPIAKDPRGLKLDHIYLRGCQAKSAKVLGHIRSSDHRPLQATIYCGN